jgi:hypothetical protein
VVDSSFKNTVKGDFSIAVQVAIDPKFLSKKGTEEGDRRGSLSSIFVLTVKKRSPSSIILRFWDL